MSDYPPVRAITRGPGYHWFGYYDKWQIDPTGRYALGMEVDFEHRSPSADDTVALGIIDMEDGDTWSEFGRTRAWCWQQGCMLQWIPNSDTDVIFNDREGDAFVSRIYNVKTGAIRTLPHAIYTLSPDGKTAIGADFRRINHMRPGYGYAGISDPNHDVCAPDDVGIYTVDLETGESTLIVAIAEVAAIPYPHGDISGARHYFNHLLFNTDGSRFIFLHRWRFGEGGFYTRMMTANADGSSLHVVDDYGKMSHFIWRDPQTILGWAYHPSHENKFYLYRDLSDAEPEVIGAGVMTVNGHCTYLPGNAWILNDSYPSHGHRHQIPYLYHVATGKRVDLGIFPSPEPYTGEWRCDLHPRYSPDGQFVVVDSAHRGNGRQMYRIAVDASTKENGNLQLIPGSHRKIIPHIKATPDVQFQEMADAGYYDPDQLVDLEMQPGEFILFNERTLHHSKANDSDLRRIGLAVRAIPPIVHVLKYDSKDHALQVIHGKDTMGFNRVTQPPL